MKAVNDKIDMTKAGSLLEELSNKIEDLALDYCKEAKLSVEVFFKITANSTKNGWFYGIEKKVKSE